MGVNDVTGDRISSKKPSKKYDDGYDRIFRKKREETPKEKALYDYVEKCVQDNQEKKDGT